MVVGYSNGAILGSICKTYSSRATFTEDTRIIKVLHFFSFNFLCKSVFVRNYYLGNPHSEQTALKWSPGAVLQNYIAACDRCRCSRLRNIALRLRLCGGCVLCLCDSVCCWYMAAVFVAEIIFNSGWW